MLSCLTLENGCDESEVKEVIRNGFAKLYSTSLCSAPCHIQPNSTWHACIIDEDRDSLDADVIDEEIRAGLWSLKAFKAPRPDGLHTGFFQRFWLVVGRFVMEEVKKVFLLKKVPKFLNSTLISLIPKIPSPKTLSNYRPISLCNMVYKIVLKVIVARLRPLLDQVISPLQTAFILGRKGTDNAILVQELIHIVSRKKGKVGYMAIKIDLEKAYDKLEWSFIMEMLTKINLPQGLIKLIMSCISSVNTSILLNGARLDQFFPSRGIRQGDPLSPYIFIICMEFLGHLIEAKCSSKSWNPVKSARGGLAFSHLFFADDLVLFARADHDNCTIVREVLDEFCN